VASRHGNHGQDGLWFERKPCANPGGITIACTVLYAIPPTSILGAILLTGYLGGAMASHVRIDSPLFSHTLFGLYLGLMVWGGLWLRDRRLCTLIPFRR
jgi:hypothetical protein